MADGKGRQVTSHRRACDLCDIDEIVCTGAPGERCPGPCGRPAQCLPLSRMPLERLRASVGQPRINNGTAIPTWAAALALPIVAIWWPLQKIREFFE